MGGLFRGGFSSEFLPLLPLFNTQESREGSVREGGRCADLSQIAHQICTELVVIGFVHHIVANWSVANSKVNFGQSHANTPSPMPPSRISEICPCFRPLLTPVSTTPFFASLSLHGLPFMVYEPSRFFHS